MTNDDTSKRTADVSQEELEHGRELLRLATERRRRLERQSAKLGMNIPFNLTIELEDSRRAIEELEEQIEGLEAAVQAREEQLSTDQPAILEAGTVFAPKWSVLRSHVQYVDANLAYRFADASEDVNIVLGFATLFLGAGLSFVASLIAAQTPSQRVLYGTFTGFCILLTLIFGVLTRRVYNRAKEVKKQILASGEIE